MSPADFTPELIDEAVWFVMIERISERMSAAELALVEVLVLPVDVVPVVEAAAVSAAVLVLFDVELELLVVVLLFLLAVLEVLVLSVLEELLEAYSGWYLKMTLCCFASLIEPSMVLKAELVSVPVFPRPY